MPHTCWILRDDTGFLMSPDPVSDLREVDTGFPDEVAQELQELADNLPTLVADDRIRGVMRQLPIRDMSNLAECDDFRIMERFFQIYSHFANAFVWCDQEDPSDYIPASVAVPLVQLANMVERPPIMPYASTSLANFQRVDPDGGYGVDNLRCIQRMIDTQDESWFHLIHVEIEAHAGGAVFALQEASRLAQLADPAGVERELAKVPPVFDRMIRTFRRITEKCSTEVYYFTLRPYLFGFDDVVYQGVDEFGEKPMTFRGESGAQSTVIPAIKALLGLSHAESGLTEHLDIMKDYMPKPHRAVLAGIKPTAIREFVMQMGDPNLREIYNLCLERMVDFRSLHLGMAHAFIAQKVKDPRGTGGTEFMKWLTILRDETAQQLITA